MPRLLLRLLAGVHLVAFVSLWTQIEGLVGSRGILPASEYFDYIRRVVEGGPFERFARAPSLFWFGSDDLMLHLVCASGGVLALLAIAGMVTLPVFAALWFCYLSLVWAGQTFLAFQWDSLLLEATLCAVVLAPLGWRSGSTSQPPSPAERVTALFRSRPRAPAEGAGIWLFRLLVVKLMFLSGATKLVSLDPAWRQLSALEVHYFTQPLPVMTSWYVHQLPESFHRLSVLVMFVVELAAPWLLFVPRLRRVAMWLLVGLQLLIAATGNYGFFNLLSAVLCLSWYGGKDTDRAPGGFESAAMTSRRIRFTAAAAVLGLSLLVGIRELTRSLPRGPDTPPQAAAIADFVDGSVVQPTTTLLRAVAPFRSISGYGLFRTMTTSRPEIVVETSADGSTWTELAFRFKPGDVHRAPRAAQPHMPRLDWQMWFAALDPQRADWLAPFVTRVFEGEPAVMRLLGNTGAQAGKPPNYLRLRLYEYSFSEPGDGAWWRRELLYDLSPLLERGAFLANSS